jgi:hypothetical protein
MTREDRKIETRKTSRARWTKPQLKYVGNLSEILQGGGGKLTVAGGDPGEGRKEKGSAR